MNIVRKVRIAVAGAGLIGLRHIEEVERCPATELSAIVDPGAKAPEIAVIVLIEHGGSGPTQAAPIAMQIVREYTRLNQSRKHAGP